MGAEEEINGRDHAEEAHGLEYQRQENPEGGEDGDQRGEQQHGEHAALDLGPRGEIRLEAGEGPGRGDDSDDQRQRHADPAIEGDRLAIGFDQRLGFGNEHAFGCAGGDITRFGKDRIASHAEGGQGCCPGARQHMLHDQVLRDRVPQRGEQQHRDADPQSRIPGVIDRKRSKATIGRLALEFPRARAGHQPTGKPEPDGKEERYG